MKECTIDFSGKKTVKVEHDCLNCLVAEEDPQDSSSQLEFFTCGICEEKFFRVKGKEEIRPYPKINISVTC